MCGIIGIAGTTGTQEEARALMAGLDTLARRGPDSGGHMKFDGAIFGHRRLSIIDLKGGSQPMQDHTGAIAITYNGEIYNYRALRTSLERSGHSFITHSDTEVILEAYRAYGHDCVRHLDGMFAFAIWDKEKHELFLARDRFGEKPLYYTQVGDRFLFASEIKALLATEIVQPIIDPVSLDNFLALSYVPPWRSIYKNIKPLPPAHYAVFKDNTLTQERYWSLKRHPRGISFDDAADTIREMLGESVRSRLIADVEIGSFLSGGIDSGIITALAQEAISPKKLKTFSAGFEDFVNELPYAERIARQYGTDHYATQIKTDLAASLREVSAYFDEPFADSSNVPVHILSAFARTQVPVALSGDGGDELFFGYGHYRTLKNLPIHHKLAKRIREHLFGHHPKHLTLFFSSPSERQNLWRDPSSVENDLSAYLDLSEAETDLQKINLIDFSMTLPGDILTKVDRASMMHSLEVRSPFLNHKLAEFVYNLPDEYKLSRERGKIAIMHAFENHFPKDFFLRKKQGFGAPIKIWLRKEEFRPLLNGLLMPTAHIHKLMKSGAVNALVSSFLSGNDSLARRAWTLLTLELWLETHPKSHT